MSNFYLYVDGPNPNDFTISANESKLIRIGNPNNIKIDSTWFLIDNSIMDQTQVTANGDPWDFKGWKWSSNVKNITAKISYINELGAAKTEDVVVPATVKKIPWPEEWRKFDKNEPSGSVFDTIYQNIVPTYSGTDKPKDGPNAHLWDNAKLEILSLETIWGSPPSALPTLTYEILTPNLVAMTLRDTTSSPSSFLVKASSSMCEETTFLVSSWVSWSKIDGAPEFRIEPSSVAVSQNPDKFVELTLVPIGSHVMPPNTAPIFNGKSRWIINGVEDPTQTGPTYSLKRDKLIINRVECISDIYSPYYTKTNNTASNIASVAVTPWVPNYDVTGKIVLSTPDDIIAGQASGTATVVYDVMPPGGARVKYEWTLNGTPVVGAGIEIPVSTQKVGYNILTCRVVVEVQGYNAASERTFFIGFTAKEADSMPGLKLECYTDKSNFAYSEDVIARYRLAPDSTPLPADWHTQTRVQWLLNGAIKKPYKEGPNNATLTGARRGFNTIQALVTYFGSTKYPEKSVLASPATFMVDYKDTPFTFTAKRQYPDAPAYVLGSVAYLCTVPYNDSTQNYTYKLSMDGYPDQVGTLNKYENDKVLNIKTFAEGLNTVTIEITRSAPDAITKVYSQVVTFTAIKDTVRPSSLEWDLPYGILHLGGFVDFGLKYLSSVSEYDKVFKWFVDGVEQQLGSTEITKFRFTPKLGQEGKTIEIRCEVTFSLENYNSVTQVLTTTIDVVKLGDITGKFDILTINGHAYTPVMYIRRGSNVSIRTDSNFSVNPSNSTYTGPDYRWEINGVITGNSPYPITSFSIQNFSESRQGTYQGHIKFAPPVYPPTIISSKVLTLKLKTLVDVGVEPVTVYRYTSDAVTLTPPITVDPDALPELTYVWKKGSQVIANTHTLSLPADDTKFGDYTFTVDIPDTPDKKYNMSAAKTVQVQVIKMNPAAAVVEWEVPGSMKVTPASTEVIPAKVTILPDGHGAVTYQWLKDGVAIPGADSLVYNLPGVANDGKYTIQIVIAPSEATTGGTFTSPVITVVSKITVPITVSVDPGIGMLYEGESGQFTASIQGNTTTYVPTYEWRKKGEPTVISTNAVLGIAGRADEFVTYEVTATLKGATIETSTATADLMITKKMPMTPTISGRPSGVVELDPFVVAILDPEASSEPLLQMNYKWFKDGVHMPYLDNQSVMDLGVYNNPINSSFTCEVSIPGSMHYTAVTETLGPWTIRPTTQHVSITFANPNSTVKVAMGETVPLYLDTIIDPPGINGLIYSYQWQDPAGQVIQDTEIVNKSIATAGDYGVYTYTITVGNWAYPSVQASSTLTVENRPKLDLSVVIDALADIEVHEGKPWAVRPKISVLPNIPNGIVYKWKALGADLIGFGNAKNLEFASAYPKQSGLYYIEVTFPGNADYNEHYSASNVFSVDVIPAPPVWNLGILIDKPYPDIGQQSNMLGVLTTDKPTEMYFYEWYNPQGVQVASTVAYHMTVNSEDDYGEYTCKVMMQDSSGAVYEISKTTEVLSPKDIVIDSCRRYIHDLKAASNPPGGGRNAGFLWMGWWVIDEIMQANEEGFAWQLDPYNDRFKYKCDLVTLVYGFSHWPELEIQESRDGYILNKADLIK